MLKLSESCEILQEGDALYNSEQCGDAGRPSACTLACSMVVYKVVQVTQSSQYLWFKSIQFARRYCDIYYFPSCFIVPSSLGFVNCAHRIGRRATHTRTHMERRTYCKQEQHNKGRVVCSVFSVCKCVFGSRTDICCEGQVSVCMEPISGSSSRTPLPAFICYTQTHWHWQTQVWLCTYTHRHSLLKEPTRVTTEVSGLNMSWLHRNSCRPDHVNPLQRHNAQCTYKVTFVRNDAALSTF